VPYSRRGSLTEALAGQESFLVQPFTEAEWDASNFALPEDVQRFRDAKYGMFIHFGLSAHDNADLSWGTCFTRKAPDCGHGPVPDEVWKAYPASLTFDAFHAGEWVAIARQAGFRYIVVIAKHHEGFHLWNTAHSAFNVMNTPFGRDYLKEIADACHAAGMGFGIYYSQRDWFHPEYMPVDPQKVVQEGTGWTLKPGAGSPMGERHRNYIDYQYRACEELCSTYGRVDVFWWDAAWWGGMFTAEMWDAENLTRRLRELQPHMLMNNRCSLPGDFDTPEQRVGHFQDGRPWESCICLENGWSFTGAPPKPREELIRLLVNNTCCDGNTLLSWGPRWDGAFDPAQRDRLLEVGAWITDNARAIYGTRGGPWKFSSWGGSVRTGSTVYLHVVEWPGETLALPEIPGRRAVSARLLDGTPVSFRQAGGALRITVPVAHRTDPDTIVEVVMDESVAAIAAMSGVVEGG
jgi:alpha-L-fucosidase